MTVMLHQLVRDLASAVRAALPSGWLAANDEDDAALVALARRVCSTEPGLMALLLQRADEERISVCCAARGGRREARVLQGLVSRRTMARSRRRPWRLSWLGGGGATASANA